MLLFEVLAIVVVIVYWLHMAGVRVSFRQKNSGEKIMIEKIRAATDAKQTAANAPPPVNEPLPVLPMIKHDIPDNPELAAYMRDLPQKIRNVGEAQRLAAKLETDVRLGLWQNAIVKVIELIRPQELFYAITWNAHCIVTKRGSARKDYECHGVVFFSNMRFLHYKDPANIIEFPMTEIYTVEAHKGYYFDGISFRTQDTHIQLTFAGAIDRKLFRDMVIHLAASAACMSYGSDDGLPKVSECPGCGATIIIHTNIKSKCDFCGRFVERNEIKTPNNCVADEIRKYKELLDTGTITQQEFENVKKKLLTKI